MFDSMCNGAPRLFGSNNFSILLPLVSTSGCNGFRPGASRPIHEQATTPSPIKSPVAYDGKASASGDVSKFKISPRSVRAQLDPRMINPNVRYPPIADTSCLLCFRPIAVASQNVTAEFSIRHEGSLKGKQAEADQKWENVKEASPSPNQRSSADHQKN